MLSSYGDGSNSITRQEKGSMNKVLEKMERTQAQAVQVPLLEEVSYIPGKVP
jgi:hypothetical protein